MCHLIKALRFMRKNRVLKNRSFGYFIYPYYNYTTSLIYSVHHVSSYYDLAFGCLIERRNDLRAGQVVRQDIHVEYLYLFQPADIRSGGGSHIGGSEF